MNKRLRSIAPWVAVLLVCAGLGAAAAQMLQRSVPVRTGEAGCKALGGTGKRISCLSELYEGRLRGDAPSASAADRARFIEAGLGRIEQTAAADEQLQGDCHQALHAVGRAEGTRAARAGASLAFPADPERLCTAGYVHGLVEGFLSSSDSSVAALPMFRAACSQREARAGCAHGLGHAMLRGGRSVDEGVAACNDLPDVHRLDCANGIFMERAVAPPVPTSDAYSRECAAQGQLKLRSACFHYLASNAAANDLEAPEAIAACAGHGTAEDRSCMRALGRSFGPANAEHCAGAEATGLRSACLTGVFELSLSSRYITPDAARERCAELSADGDLPAELGRLCVDAVDELLTAQAA